MKAIFATAISPSRQSLYWPRAGDISAIRENARQSWFFLLKAKKQTNKEDRYWIIGYFLPSFIVILNENLNEN